MNQRPPDLTEKTFALMKEKGLTYSEARKELGRRGATVRAANRRRRDYRSVMMNKLGLS